MQIWEFHNLHMAQCAKIIVGFMATVGNVFFIQLLLTFFFIFSTLFYVFKAFLFSSDRLLHLRTASQRYNLRERTHSLQLPEHSAHLSDFNFITHMLYKN